MLSLICLVLSLSILTNNMALSSDGQNILQFIELYKSQHSRNVVLSDPNLCDRKFVLSHYACPYMVGRGMHEYVNAFIGAFVTNRTLLWQYCPRKPCSVDDEETCGKYVIRGRWISGLFEVEERWKELKCPSTLHQLETVISAQMRHWSERKLACCGIDGLNQTNINYGGFVDRREMANLALPFIPIGDEARSRIKALFSRGEDYAYGIAFRASFEFTDFIKKQNDALLQPIKALGDDSKRVYIGLHIRHANNREDGTTECGEIPCVTKVLQALEAGEFKNDLWQIGPDLHRRRKLIGWQRNSQNDSCVVMIASDRSSTVERMQKEIKDLGCLSAVTNHTAVMKSFGEHGPFWGEIAMLDLELLSRSDVFVGSTYTVTNAMLSSYSMLIASLVASQPRFASFNLPQLESRVRWLPVCGPAAHGKLMREQEKFEFCYDVLMPRICPYYNASVET